MTLQKEKGQTKMFLSHCLQNPANSDKSLQISSWIHVPQNSINVFHRTWVMRLHYLVKFNIRVFMKILMLEKRYSTNFLLFTIIVDRFYWNKHFRS